MVRPQSATPLGYAVSQVDDVSCLASGDATTQSSVSVQVLPEASTQWATYAEKTADVVSGAASTYGEASHVSCLGRGAESACWRGTERSSPRRVVGCTGLDRHTPR